MSGLNHEIGILLSSYGAVKIGKRSVSGRDVDPVGQVFDEQLLSVVGGDSSGEHLPVSWLQVSLSFIYS